MITWIIFGCSLALIVYTFVGYPILLWLRARLWPRQVQKADYTPTVTFLIAAHNEERVIKRKLDSIFGVEYPARKIEAIVISDGSTDQTNVIVRSYGDPRLHLIALPQRCGKAVALNHGMGRVRSEIVVFTDARQVLEPSSVRNMMSNFADSSVGCVSGKLMIGELNSERVTGEAAKWGMENRIRYWEGLTTSVVGALGAFYAADSKLLVPLPAGTLLDDCYLPLNIVRAGKRTVFEAEARVWDDVVTTTKQEFRRKVRTVAGNYQLLRLAPWLLSSRNPILLEFISHKICRLMLPLGFAGLLLSSLLSPSPIVRIFGLAQLCGYALGVLATVRPRLGPLTRIADVARTAVVLNASAVSAFVKVVTGVQATWAVDTKQISAGYIEPCGTESNVSSSQMSGSVRTLTEQ